MLELKLWRPPAIQQLEVEAAVEHLRQKGPLPRGPVRDSGLASMASPRLLQSYAVKSSENTRANMRYDQAKHSTK